MSELNHNGDVAQMVERSLCMREARGSIPRISISFWASSFFRFAFLPGPGRPPKPVQVSDRSPNYKQL